MRKHWTPPWGSHMITCPYLWTFRQSLCIKSSSFVLEYVGNQLLTSVLCSASSEHAGSGAAWTDGVWAFPEVPTECLNFNLKIPQCHISEARTQVRPPDLMLKRKMLWSSCISFISKFTPRLSSAQPSPAGRCVREQRRVSIGSATRKGGLFNI